MAMLNQLFITLRWLDVIDIFLVAFLLYQLYNLVKGTVAINIFVGILLFYLIWTIVKALNMQLFGNILGKFIDVGVIALIIVFQQELRRFLLMLGTTDLIRKGKGGIGRRLFNISWKTKTSLLNVDAVVLACKRMAESKTGALIILTTRSELKFYEDTGEPINSVVSANMIETIFYKNNPMHDGAIIITNNQIKAARYVLPVTEDSSFPSHLGMRHRAAVGLTENSDAIALIVSEQTGDISYAKEGTLINPITKDRLKELLEKEFKH